MKIWSEMDGDERDKAWISMIGDISDIKGFLDFAGDAIDELQACLKLGPYGNENQKTRIKLNENNNKGADNRAQPKKKG